MPTGGIITEFGSARHSVRDAVGRIRARDSVVDGLNIGKRGMSRVSLAARVVNRRASVQPHRRYAERLLQFFFVHFRQFFLIPILRRRVRIKVIVEDDIFVHFAPSFAFRPQVAPQRRPA